MLANANVDLPPTGWLTELLHRAENASSGVSIPQRESQSSRNAVPAARWEGLMEIKDTLLLAKSALDEERKKRQAVVDELSKLRTEMSARPLENTAEIDKLREDREYWFKQTIYFAKLVLEKHLVGGAET